MTMELKSNKFEPKIRILRGIALLEPAPKVWKPNSKSILFNLFMWSIRVLETIYDVVAISKKRPKVDYLATRVHTSHRKRGAKESCREYYSESTDVKSLFLLLPSCPSFACFRFHMFPNVWHSLRL